MEKPQVKRILTMKKLPNSSKGNPRWQVWFTDGDVRTTQSDSNVGQDINQPQFRNRDVRLTFTRAGRIASIEAA